MVNDNQPAPPHPDELVAKEERGRRIVAKAMANKKLMDGVRESIEARARGEQPVLFEDLKHKDA